VDIIRSEFFFEKQKQKPKTNRENKHCLLLLLSRLLQMKSVKRGEMGEKALLFLETELTKAEKKKDYLAPWARVPV